MRIVPFVIFALSLTGCSSGGLLTRNVDYTASDQQTCSGYGFRPQTDAYAQCMLQLDQIRSERNANARERRRAALLSMSRTLMAPTPRPMVICNGSTYGNTSTVMCQ